MKRNEQLLNAMGDVGMDLVEMSEVHEPFGGKWRRWGSLAACLVLVAGITAAGIHFLPRLVSTQPDPNSTLSDTPDPDPSPGIHIPTPPIADETDGPAIPDFDEQVTTLYDLQGSYTDGIGNEFTYLYQVPQLRFSGAEHINEKIAGTFGKAVEEQLQAMEDGVSLHTTDIGFTEYWNGDIVTLVCWEHTSYDYSVYAAYHYDTNNGKGYHTGTVTGDELTNKGLLEALGIDPEEYMAALKQAAASRYLFNAMLWGNFAPGQLFEDDFRWEQFKKTVSEENLDLYDVPMYVTQGNEGLIVRAFPNIYAIAGADCYPTEVAVMGEKPQWTGAAESDPLGLAYRITLDGAWTDTMDMTLYVADPENPDVSGAYETVTLTRGWYYERFCVLMDSYTWTPYETNCPDPGNFWLNLSGGSVNWTFWDDGDAGFLMIQSDKGMPVCWKADHIDGAAGYNPNEGFTIADALRFEYDGAAINYEKLALELSGTSSDEIAAQFADAYGRHLCSQAPGSNYGATEYAVISTEVVAVAGPYEDGTDKAMLFTMQLALKPELDGMRSALWAGNGMEGTGQWEGWMIFSREVIIQLWSDGLWHCTDFGTGGVMLPSTPSPIEGE